MFRFNYKMETNMHHYEGMNLFWYVHSMEYNSPVKKKKKMTYVYHKINLIIIRKEDRQKEYSVI